MILQALALLCCSAASRAADDTVAFPTGFRVLFQGDSITDGNRGRSPDPNHILGHGYVFIIAAQSGARYPERQISFLNRGISGNKVSDLAARWQTDTLDLKPDVLSILVGINDLNGGVSADDYEKQYDKLLSDTEAADPKVRIVLMEPFGLPVGPKKDVWPQFHQDLLQRQAAVARLARKHHAVLVHLQRVFDEACRRAPADYWIWDGIHPTYSGHQLVADEWARAVRQEHAPIGSAN